MNLTTNPDTWEETAPYTAMLRRYQTAADKLVSRQDELKGALRQMLHSKQGTPASAHEQKVLEDRLLLLRTEYVELADAMRQIRFYAAREAQ